MSDPGSPAPCSPPCLPQPPSPFPFLPSPYRGIYITGNSIEPSHATIGRPNPMLWAVVVDVEPSPACCGGQTSRPPPHPARPLFPLPGWWNPHRPIALRLPSFPLHSLVPSGRPLTCLPVEGHSQWYYWPSDPQPPSSLVPW